jgi:hypothetical protein
MNSAKFLFDATVNNTGPKIVSSAPSVRRQGNGNFTGFIRKTWSDGTSADELFIENARTVDDVRASYLARAA